MNLFGLAIWHFLTLMTPLECGRMVARVGTTPEAIAYQNKFGEFLSKNIGDSGRRGMMQLARAAFQVRLRFSAKHDMEFINSVGDKWKYRIAGRTSGIFYSFALMARNNPANIELFNLLEARLNDYPPSCNISVLVSNRFTHPQSFECIIPHCYWTFSLRKKKGISFSFKIFQVKTSMFLLHHARGNEITGLMKHLAILWANARNKSLHADQRLLALAEWEWLWFWTNPFGRGGAITGDSLSLILQHDMRDEGLPIQIRTKFRALDLEALSQSHPDYVEMRLADWRDGESRYTERIGRR